MADREFDTMTPEVAAELVAAAEFLLPLAQEVFNQGGPVEPAAWLTFIREQFSTERATFH